MANISTIPREVFVPRMVKHWKKLRNQTSPALEEAWGELADIFNRQITGEPEPIPKHGTITFPAVHMLKWSVVPMPTGTGKTTCLELYCALMAKREPHPGILIVTEFTKAADTLRDKINKLAKVETAISYHSKNRDKLKIAACKHSPVLIITHAAFKQIMRAEAKKRQYASNWKYFMQWQGGVRKLVVIDEVLNVVEHIRITSEDLEWVQTVMPVEVAKHYKNETAVIDYMRAALLRKCNEHDGTDMMIAPEEWGIIKPHDFDALSSALRRLVAHEAIHYAEEEEELDDDEEILPDTVFNYASYQKFTKIFAGLHHILHSASRLSKVGNEFRLTSAHVILPPEIRNAVVLDATKEPNRLYAMLGNVPDCKWLPDNIRNYRNVTLRVFWGRGLGKFALKKQPQEHFAHLIEGLAPYIGKKNKVLFCSFKAVEHHFQKVTKGKYKAVDAMHWGAIAGKNYWDDYDSLVIYGVLNLPAEIPKNALRAFQEWHDKTGNKFEQAIPYVNEDKEEYLGGDYSATLDAHEVYLDEADYQHQEFAIGAATTDLVQAINRVRCRRVIDSEGNCEPTSIFLFMNQEQKFRTTLENIKRMMPGIMVYEDELVKPVKLTRSIKNIVKYLRNRPEGVYDAHEVCWKVKPRISGGTKDRTLGDKDGRLKGALTAINTRYEAKPGNGGFRRFIKGKMVVMREK